MINDWSTLSLLLKAWLPTGTRHEAWVCVMCTYGWVCGNIDKSSASAMLLHPLCINPSIWHQNDRSSLFSRSNYRWVRSWRWGCLVTWFCYQLIAKPGNKTAPPPWPDPDAPVCWSRPSTPATLISPYEVNCKCYLSYLVQLMVSCLFSIEHSYKEMPVTSDVIRGKICCDLSVPQ